MPNKEIPSILARLVSLEQKLNKHLDDGITVLTNIERLTVNVKWLTWLCTAIAGGLLAHAIALVLKR